MWKFTTRNGNARSIRMYNRKESKLKIINFWATYCKPCVEELGRLLKLEKRIRSLAGVLMYFVSEDTGAKRINQFQRMKKRYFDTLISLGEEVRSINLGDNSSIPTTIVLNTENEIIGCFEGALNDNNVRELLSLVEARDEIPPVIGPVAREPPVEPKTDDAEPAGGDIEGEEPDELAVSKRPSEGQEVREQAEAASDPYKTWGHATFWSGAGLMTLGLVFALPAQSAANDYNDMSKALKYRAASLDNSRPWAGAMWAGLATGAALMTTGVVLWLLDSPMTEDADTSAAIVPTLDGAGAVLTLGGRW